MSIKRCGARMSDLEFTIPFKERWMPYRPCQECFKRKRSVWLYKVHDNGLNCHIKIYCCNKCLKEAKKRIKNEYIIDQ